MKLLLDIGNTRIKWAYLADGGLQQGGDQVHRGQPEGAVRQLLEQLPETPEQAAAVNVAGAGLESMLAESLQQILGVELQCLRTAEKWGELRNGYTDHTQLGADRWAAMAGAWQQYQGDCCVVDAGTAVTIDWVRGDGQHLGGFILPGRQLAQAALRGETADIANFAARHSDPADGTGPGQSTRDAIARGADYSLCAAIDRAVQDIPGCAGLAAEPLLILTGGDAENLQPGLASQAQLRPQLVLEGVACLAGWR